MNKERLNPLNDFAFQKAMGEKGDEIQLIAFLNAVLKRTGKVRIESVEILEDRDLPADTAGGKAGKLDVLAKLADGAKVDIEVQLHNQYNMERRSLDYWARHYIKGIEAGQDYSLLPAVICINILDFGYMPLDDFHASFHIYEDRRKEYMLTDALELHFLDMVKFRKLPEKDIQHDPLHRWLVYFDKHSSINLIEEVLRMDPAIQKMQEKIEWIQGNPDLFRAYLRYEKAASDEVTRINGARREGLQEGLQQGMQKGMQEGLQKGMQKGMQEGLQQGMQKGMQEGLQKGMQKGMQEGLQQGMQKGMQEGLQQGRMEGLQEGRIEEKLGIVSKLKKLGLPIDQIAEVAGLSAEEIAKL